ncbi:putative membrane protein [Pseudomonas aeruginosa]|nr:putative membrane protein [Pseudomonas aeruginosa]CEI13029.1 putative membrane protein [Pseudomonas aeruginosa]
MSNQFPPLDERRVAGDCVAVGFFFAASHCSFSFFTSG